MGRGSAFYLILLLSPVVQAGDIHRWVDENGGVNFGDRPPPDTKAELISVRPNVYESVSFENLSEMFAAKDEVILYSTSWCKYCKRAREYFKENNIAFTEYDVEKSDKGKRDYNRLGATGVPVILVGDRRMNGFNAEGFERMYNQ